ncbi:MAG: hypothetical protein IPL33_08405 [Sphingobacteriales bacterium]|nr:hypothetical protein [Sphingobacteriales bacterium]
MTQPADRSLLSTCDFNADGTLSGGHFSFQVDFFDDPGIGFNDPTFGAAARAVVCQALRDMSFLIEASPDCNGLPPVLRLKIDASMNEYPTSALDPIVLGRANPLYYNFSNPSGQMPGWVHNSVWRTVNGGEDPTNYPFVNGEPVYHGMMRFNFHPNISWNFDPQNVLSAPQFDLYSVVLHEICHLLGFASLVTDNGTSDIDPLGGYTPSNSGLYTNYDRLLVRNESSYSPLLSPVNNCYDITFQGNINVLTDPCNVILLRDVNTGLYLPVVAPNGWIDNVEMSHLDDIGGPFACNSTHYLMNRSVIQNALGQSFRRPTDAEINLLCSMGYKSSGVYGDGSLSFHSVVSGNNPPACGEFVAGVDDDGANCHDHFVFCELPGTISISTILANDIGVLPNIDANCIEPVVGNITFTAAPAI